MTFWPVTRHAYGSLETRRGVDARISAGVVGEIMAGMVTSSRNLRRILAASVTATVAAALIGAPAVAHTELRGSDPEEGATVDSLENVRLEFSSALLDIGAELVLVDADGASHELEPEFPEGENAVVAAVDAQAVGAGDAVLDWRIVAEDGHPISGEISFTYAPEVPEEIAPEPTETAEAPPAAQSPTPQDDASDDNETLVEPTPMTTEPISEEPEAETGAVWAWVLVALAVVGLVVTAVALSKRRDQE